MITCEECQQNLHPEDPRLPSGKYGHNSCDYFCDKPIYFRELEAQSPLEQIIIHRQSSMSAQENDILQQTSLRTKHLEKKVNEHLKPKPKRKPKYS